MPELATTQPTRPQASPWKAQLQAGLVAVALSLSLFGCKKSATEPSAAPPVDEPAARSTAPALKTSPAEALQPTGTWVCPPWLRADETGFKIGDPRYKGNRHEVLWIHDDKRFQSRSLKDQDGRWQWNKGDYDEEVSWFVDKRPGLRSEHHYLCTRVPGNNHWCKLLLSLSPEGDGDSLELLDLLRPSHKYRSYDTAAYAEDVLEGTIKPTCRYRRIADKPLDEDEVTDRVRALKPPQIRESEQP